MATRFRAAKWLASNDFAPQVFLFRNIESGQVLYSQIPKFSEYQIKKQFQRPNWENRRPTLRRDIWRIMAVANLQTYESAVKLYENLVSLRSFRDLTKKDEAMKYRPRNSDGNIWFSAQYRPIYTQEAVADLSESIDNVNEETTIYWEDDWRRGDASNWNPELVKHEVLDRIALQTPKSLLEEIRLTGRQQFLSK